MGFGLSRPENDVGCPGPIAVRPFARVADPHVSVPVAVDVPEASHGGTRIGLIPCPTIHSVGRGEGRGVAGGAEQGASHAEMPPNDTEAGQVDPSSHVPWARHARTRHAAMRVRRPRDSGGRAFRIAQRFRAGTRYLARPSHPTPNVHAAKSSPSVRPLRAPASAAPPRAVARSTIEPTFFAHRRSHRDRTAAKMDKQTRMTRRDRHLGGDDPVRARRSTFGHAGARSGTPEHARGGQPALAPSPTPPR